MKFYVFGVYKIKLNFCERFSYNIKNMYAKILSKIQMVYMR